MSVMLCSLVTDGGIEFVEKEERIRKGISLIIIFLSNIKV